MSQQIQITGGAKVRDLQDVIIGTSGVLSSLAFNVANGVPKLDVNGKILVSQLPNSVMEYKGTWNAATNTPTLVNGTGNQGDVYLCTTAGTVDFGAGAIAFVVGDQVIYSGSIWQRASGATGTVTSVAITESGDSLNITGSPITTSGTINIGFNGTNLQYVNGAGNLTTFPILTGYVPYTGATQDVDLGAFKLNAQSLHIKGTGGLGHLGLKHQSASATASANEVSLFADSLGDLSWLNGNLYLSKFITSSNTAARSYTFPNANGTVALTSDLANYVDLTTAQTIGGTKTFSDATKNNGGIFLQNASSSSLAGYMNIGGLTNGVKFTSGGGVSNTFTLPSATGYTFTFPNATGTIALTSDISYPVTSVFGRTGAVVATSGDYTTAQVTESGNLYFTDSRARLALSAGTGISYNNTTGVITNSAPDQVVSLTAGAGISVSGTYPSFTIASTITQYTDALARAAISLTTTGTSGASTYNNTTGVLNIPQYADQFVGTVTSVAALTIGTSGTDLSSTVATSTTTPVITLNVPTASATNRGALSSADWTTFNNKQSALTNPVTGTGTTNYLPKFTGASTIGNSSIQDDGSTVSVGNTLKLSGNSNSFQVASIFRNANRVFFGGDTGGYYFQNSGNTATILNLNDTGNLGLGVTPSAWSLGTTLQIGGTYGTINYSGASAILGIVNAYYNGSSYLRQNTGSVSSFEYNIAAPNAFAWRLDGSGSAGTTTSLPIAMTLSTSGLEVGYSAVQGAYKLDVNGTGRFSGNVVISAASGAVSLTLLTGSSYGYFYNDGTNIGLASNLGSTGLKLIVSRSAPDSSLVIASTGAATFSSSVTANQFVINGSYIANADATSGRFLFGDGNSANAALRMVTNSASVFYLDAVKWGSSATEVALSLQTNGGALLVGTSTNAGYTFDVNGTGRFSGNVVLSGSDSRFNGGDSVGRLIMSNSNTTTYIGLYGATHPTLPYVMSFVVNSASALSIASTGAATFSSSVTATGLVSGGNSSPSTSYNAGSWFTGDGLVAGNISSVCGIQINSSTTSTLSAIRFGDGDGANNLYDQGFIIYRHTTDSMIFGTNRSTALTIASTGAATFSSSVTAGGLVTINKQNEGLILTAGANTDASYMSTRANNGTGWMIMGSQGSVANYIQTGTGANESAITTVGAYALALGTNQTERMRITSGGNVGIGTNSPAYKFVVSNGGALGLEINPAGSGYTEILNYNRSTAAYQQLQFSASSVLFNCSVTATSFFESSDSRLKTLIQDNYQTKGIASITPKLYTKNGKVELGYYAQDFVGILDSAVSKGSDDMLSLSYREVHTAKIYALEQEIKELKAKMN